jgi:hypothetical protein
LSTISIELETGEIMKKIFVLVLIVLSASILFASNKIVLKDLSYPTTITAHQDRLYFGDNTNVFIYSLKDFKLLKKFGGTGSGPGKFTKASRPWRAALYIYPVEDHLMIIHDDRFSLYTKDGEFIKETKKKLIGLAPIGKKFIGLEYSFKNDFTYEDFYITNNDFQKEKLIYRYKSPLQKGQLNNILLMIFPGGYFCNKQVTKDAYYLPTHDGTIHVFDIKGNERFTITPDYPKIIFTDALKKKFLDFFKNDFRYGRLYELVTEKSKWFQFPEHLPLRKADRISDGKYYIITSSKKDGKYETLVYDLKGKFLNKTLLPLKDKDLIDLYPFTIYKGKIYQVIKNKDKSWELIISAIN